MDTYLRKAISQPNENLHVDKVLQVGRELIEIVYLLLVIQKSHCDLHPGNIMVLKDDEPINGDDRFIRIIDFGKVSNITENCKSKQWKSKIYWDLRNELIKHYIQKDSSFPKETTHTERWPDFLFVDLKVLMRNLQLLCIFLFIIKNKRQGSTNPYTTDIFNKHKSWLGHVQSTNKNPSSANHEYDEVFEVLLSKMTEERKNRVLEQKEAVKSFIHTKTESERNRTKQKIKNNLQVEIFQSIEYVFNSNDGETKKEENLNWCQLFVINSDWEAICEQISPPPL